MDSSTGGASAADDSARSADILELLPALFPLCSGSKSEKLLAAWTLRAGGPTSPEQGRLIDTEHRDFVDRHMQVGWQNGDKISR